MYYYPVTVYPTSTPQQLATTQQQQQPYHILQQQQVVVQFCRIKCPLIARTLY